MSASNRHPTILVLIESSLGVALVLCGVCVFRLTRTALFGLVAQRRSAGRR